MAVAVRQCSATNRAGEPCANPVVLDSGLCVAHDPDSRIAANFAAGHPGLPGAGRPRLPGSIELARLKLEEDAEAWHGVLEDARRATKAVWVGGDDGQLVETPDHQTRITAYREAHDRVYGKATQRTEVEHSGSLSLDLLLADQPNANQDNHKFEETA